MATSICARLRAGVTTASAAETRALAEELAVEIPPNVVLALHGDLGVGKTTFAQGLARGLGVKEAVTSPTFAIYSVYQGRERKFVHLDAYRLEHAGQLETLLLEEFLTPPWTLAVEWPEKIEGWLPADAWHVTLSIVEGDRHRIVLM
jgi:tRNA threonylcarbamoyladenosine biosynthesis protein TsaE